MVLFEKLWCFDRQTLTSHLYSRSHKVAHVCKITLKLLLFSPWQNGVDFLSIAIKLMTAFSLSAKAHYNFLPNKEGKTWKTRRMDGDHQYTIGPNNFWIQIHIQIGIFNSYKANISRCVDCYRFYRRKLCFFFYSH